MLGFLRSVVNFSPDPNRSARHLLALGFVVLQSPIALAAPWQHIEDWCGASKKMKASPDSPGSSSIVLGGPGCTVGNCPQNGPCDDPVTRNQSIPTPTSPLLNVALQFHVFRADDGTGALATAARIDQQVAQLNLDFTDARIHFFHLTRFVNDSRYLFTDTVAEEFAMKGAYALSPSTLLNIYVTHLDNFLGGALGDGVNPWDSTALQSGGGVMIDPDVVAATGFTSHVLTHEVGHALGLWHTHHGISEVAQCSTCYECLFGSGNDLRGDFCADTPPTPANSTCSDPAGLEPCTQNSWNGNTDPTNYMGNGPAVFPSVCMNHFSPQQMGRMRCWLGDVISGWVQDQPTIRVPFDFASIGLAITNATDGSTILVADGNYFGSNNRGLLVQKSLSIVSENGPANCTIDCQDLSFGFLVNDPMILDPEFTLDGFTIKRANSSGTIATGGAVSIENESVRATVRNCRIQDCTSEARGGGIHSIGENLLVERCVIQDNTVIDPDNGEGGGIWTRRDAIAVGDIRIIDSIISGNTAPSDGGGLHIERAGSFELRNCTIANNRVTNPDFSFGGGAFFLEHSGSGTQWSIRNNIFWGNTVEDDQGARGDQIAFYSCCGTSPISYCDIQGGPANIENLDQVAQWGAGNIATNPLFVDVFGNFHIRGYSPCVNQGDPAFTPAPTELDVDGAARVLEARVDIGADETLDVPAPPSIHETEEAILSPFDPVLSGGFGTSVDVDGDTMVVGSNGSASGTGAAYVYVRNQTSWTLQQKLVGSDVVSGDGFGHAVAISGNTIAVGSPDDDGTQTDAGSVYVFFRSGTAWSQQAKLTAAVQVNTDRLGWSVDIEEDTLVGGAPSNPFFATTKGAFYAFQRTGSTWSAPTKVTAGDGVLADAFGTSVALHGTKAIIGAPHDDNNGWQDSGSAYIFTHAGPSWAQSSKITPGDLNHSDGFGDSVAYDGSTIVVGATTADVGSQSAAGAAYVFSSGGGLVQKLVATDAATDDNFGKSVAVQGNVIVVGAPGQDTTFLQIGQAYIYTRSGTVWTESAAPMASIQEAGADYGFALAIDDGTIAIGAFHHIDPPTFPGGLVFVEALYPGIAFCFGDGTGTQCPCSNPGTPGHGCNNSIPTGGGLLTSYGLGSVSNDSVILRAWGMPAATSATFVQGTTTPGGGFGVGFNDGLHCAGGSMIVLANKAVTAGGASTFPEPGDSSISVAGSIPPAGSTRFYQVRYHDPNSFCTPGPLNSTQALAIVWGP